MADVGINRIEVLQKFAKFIRSSRQPTPQPELDSDITGDTDKIAKQVFLTRLVMHGTAPAKLQK